MSRYPIFAVVLAVLLLSTCILSQNTATQPPHDLNTPSTINSATNIKGSSGLKRLSSSLDSTRTLDPSQWPIALQHLMSFQKLSILHRFGRYGLERDDFDMHAQIQNELPELKEIYSPNQFVDFHNYILPPTNPIPQSLLLNTTITQMSTNIPFDKINAVIAEQIKSTTSTLTDIASRNKTTPDVTNTTEDDLIHKKQHEVYSLIKEHFPSSAYIRLEITGEYDDLVREWFETYPQNHELSYILLKFSSFFRQLGHGKNRQKQTVLYIEPDLVIHHGKHYQRLSQHGKNTGILLVIIFFLIIGSQLGFQYWQQTHQSTYDIFIVGCLWVVPLGVALLDHFRRFIIIWWLYTAMTVIVLSLLLIDINPLVNKFLQTLEFSDDPSSQQQQQSQSQQYYMIPQRYIFSIVYKYFLLVHKFIMVLLSISVIVFFLDIFGVFQALGLEPHMVGEMFKGHQATAEEVLTFFMFALYGAFYSLYFGVLNRDIATIVIPQLTVLSTRFKLSREAKRLEKAARTAKVSSQTDQILPGGGSAVELAKLMQDGNSDMKQRGGQKGGGSDPDQQWNSTNLGSILGDDITESTTTTTTHGDDVESFFGTPDTHFDQNSENNQLIDKSDKSKSSISKVSKENSCGICHELLKSQQNNNANGTPDDGKDRDHGNSTQKTNDLPTIQEIRERLRQRSLYTQQPTSNQKLIEFVKKFQQALINGIFFIVTNIFIFFIEYSDKLTGGTGEVNLDSVTIVEGMYTINAAGTARRGGATATELIDYSGNTSVLDQEDDDADQVHLSASGYASRANRYGGHGEFSNTLTTNNDVVFQLPCGCYCHDICLRGFMLLGKHNICPGCRELSNLDVFTSPWDNLYDNYRNFLDSVKYCIAVNPLLLFMINILLYFFW